MVTPLHPNFTRERSNAYIYTNLNFFRNISVTLGLSHESFKYDINRTHFLEEQGISIKEPDFSFTKTSPKVGLQWDIADNLRLRLAWFENVKSALAANQTLEPTQVAGFNQMFDDINGTRARRLGAGVDARITKKLYGGVEVSGRDLDVPLLTSYKASDRTIKQKEQVHRAYLYWLPHAYWAIRGEFQHERYDQDPRDAGTIPYRIDTLSAPLSVNYFDPSGIFARVTATHVRQEVKRLPASSHNQGMSNFEILDAMIGYRLPKRSGILSVEGRNLLNEDFFFRNINLQQSEQPLYNQRYSPDRTFFVRLTLNF